MGGGQGESINPHIKTRILQNGEMTFFGVKIFNSFDIGESALTQVKVSLSTPFHLNFFLLSGIKS